MKQETIEWIIEDLEYSLKKLIPYIDKEAKSIETFYHIESLVEILFLETHKEITKNNG